MQKIYAPAAVVLAFELVVLRALRRVARVEDPVPHAANRWRGESFRSSACEHSGSEGARRDALVAGDAPVADLARLAGRAHNVAAPACRAAVVAVVSGGDAGKPRSVRDCCERSAPTTRSGAATSTSSSNLSIFASMSPAPARLWVQLSPAAGCVRLCARFSAGLGHHRGHVRERHSQSHYTHV